MGKALTLQEVDPNWIPDIISGLQYPTRIDPGAQSKPTPGVPLDIA